MLTRRRKRTVFSEVHYGFLKVLFTFTIILLTVLPTTLGKTIETVQSSPVFEENQTREVDARFGQTVLLPCTIRNLRDKVVSWIRSKDLHILTSGVHTFSSDNRFEAVHQKEEGFWGLRIRGVGVNDAGQYECQVNTDPKMSLAVKLNLPGVRKFESSNSRWISRALIKGPSQVYVGDGSPVTFTCEISPLPISPGFIPLNQRDQAGERRQEARSSVPHEKFHASASAAPTRWLHNDVQIIQDNLKDIKINTDDYASSLSISAVKSKHAGRFTCMQPSTIPDTVKLHVVEAEHSEAMQRDYPAGSSCAPLRSLTLPVFLILVQYSVL